MKKLLLAGATAGLLAFLPAQDAQAQVNIGGQLDYAMDRSADGDGGTLGAGARLGLGLGEGFPGLGLNGRFDYFFLDCDDCNLWEVGANVTYTFPTESALGPYFGAGLLYQKFENDILFDDLEVEDSSTGFDILGGLKFFTGNRATPFVEARYELMNEDDFDDQLVLAGGVVF